MGSEEELNELDRIITNTEFETAQQIKAIAEERHKIQTLQTQLEGHLQKVENLRQHNVKLEESSKKMNGELSMLRNESYESLKSTSRVLDNHCEALQESLQLTIQMTIDQERAQQNACTQYFSIWNDYEYHYHSSSKAQTYLKLKKEFDSLKISSLSKPRLSPIQECDHEWIITIAKLKSKTSHNSYLLSGLNQTCQEKLQCVKRLEEEVKALQVTNEEKDQLQLPPNSPTTGIPTTGQSTESGENQDNDTAMNFSPNIQTTNDHNSATATSVCIPEPDHPPKEDFPATNPDHCSPVPSLTEDDTNTCSNEQQNSITDEQPEARKEQINTFLFPASNGAATDASSINGNEMSFFKCGNNFVMDGDSGYVQQQEQEGMDCFSNMFNNEQAGEKNNFSMFNLFEGDRGTGGGNGPSMTDMLEGSSATCFSEEFASLFASPKVTEQSKVDGSSDFKMEGFNACEAGTSESSSFALF